MPLGPIRLLVNSHQFRAGLVAGLIAAAAVCWGASFAKRRPLTLAGIAFVSAGYLALARSGPVAQSRHVPLVLLAGAALAFALAELAGQIRPVAWLVALAAAPGAIVTAGALVGVPGWIRVAVAGFGAIGGACLYDFDQRHRLQGISPFMWLITVGAVYSTVPDTEAARAIIAVALAVALLGWPALYARFGAGGAAASACLLGWVIGQGGAGRAGSVVGALGTIGLFALEPFVRWVRTNGRTPGRAPDETRRAYELVPMVAAHLAVALVAARWAGLAHAAGTATLRLLIVLPFALLLTRLIDVGRATRARETPPAPQHRAHPRQ
jgi:hypothetical protein